ncbi:hypothetical protein [Candidatus Methanomethylophilus sp. 1R26]|uniref:hypothetical protein n=1 Tax=Candidatus Methanomethylophilus sp. 1R26 TaxID=1769296 RepID=UPI0012FEEBC1|nr:hypothetical protein [Candidatus Methanomethylophilus sp. 1R26]
MFREEHSPSGSILFKDGTPGCIADPEYDSEVFFDRDMTEDGLIFNGRRSIGNRYIDRWGRDGEFYQGGCFLCYDGGEDEIILRQERGAVPIEGDPGRGGRPIRGGESGRVKEWKEEVPELGNFRLDAARPRSYGLLGKIAPTVICEEVSGNAILHTDIKNTGFCHYHHALHTETQYPAHVFYGYLIYV